VRPGFRTRSANPLQGTSWQLVAAEDATDESASVATLEFPETGKVSGRAPCNRFSGTVTISGRRSLSSRWTTTQIRCSDELMSQETQYFETLRGIERFQVEGPMLRLYSRHRRGAAAFHVAET
jgi:heat shock protein HslJ